MWTARTLGEICDEVDGVIQTGPFGSQLHESDYADDGVPVVMPKNILDGKIDTSDIAFIKEEDAERLQRHKMLVGDIVYGRRGDIGRRGLIGTREDGWLCGTGCLRMSLGDRVLDPTYLYYFLGQPMVIGWIANQAIGATMPNLNTGILRSVVIRYPVLSTGFDVPSCATIYLDKPMKNHTLMQTIARANRVWGEKQNGLIVDYAGVFRSLQKALAIYGTGPGGKATEGETPVLAKAELLEGLRQQVKQTVGLCESQGVDLSAIITSKAFERVKHMDDAVEKLIADDPTKKRFLASATSIQRLFKAILPDPAAKEWSPQCSAIVRVADKIRSISGPVDISEVMDDVEGLLDSSVEATQYVIRDRGPEKRIDLSKIDFEALQKKFNAGYKRTEIERLKALLQGRLLRLVEKNRTRMDFLERFQKLMDEYNAGAVNIDEFFKQLVAFSQQLDEEDKRGIAQSLTEEELAVFDLLTKPEPKLTKKAEVEVKRVAKQLLEKLKAEKLVLDWRKRQQSRAAVRLCIEEVLDKLPQDLYPKATYAKKCDLLYQHVYEAYYGSGQSIYQAA